MVRLDFVPDPGWLESRRGADFRDVSDVALKTSIFPGDQIIEVAGIDFSVIGYNIALLEFANGLFLAVRSAASTIGYGQVHPLDADLHFKFRRRGEELMVEADFTDEIGWCSLRDFDLAVRRNCGAVLRRFFGVHPEARQSKHLYKFFDVKELGVDDLFDDAAKPTNS